MTHGEVTTDDATTAASMPLERLEAEITELAGQLAAGECRWLQLVAEYDRRSGHESWGCRTIAHWLSWHCSLDMRSAREKVRVAHALEDLPWSPKSSLPGASATRRCGRSPGSRRPPTRNSSSCTPSTPPQPRPNASCAPTAGAPKDEDTAAANRLYEEQYLQVEYDLDGAGVTSGRMPPEIAAALLQALELTRKRMSADQRGEGGPAGPPRSLGAINVDALAMIIETFMAGEPAARQRQRPLDGRRQRRRRSPDRRRSRRRVRTERRGSAPGGDRSTVVLRRVHRRAHPTRERRTTHASASDRARCPAPPAVLRGSATRDAVSPTAANRSSSTSTTSITSRVAEGTSTST